MFKYRYVLLMSLIVAFSSCKDENCLRASFEVDPCFFGIFPKVEDELVMRTTSGGLAEFTSTGQYLENLVVYNSDEDCYNHQALNAYYTSGIDNATIRFNMITYGNMSEPQRFNVSYTDSLSIFPDPMSIYKRGVYSCHINDDCTVSERHHVDSTRVNNILFRDVYRVEAVSWDNPNEKKTRFRYVYFTEFGEILKFESDTETWEKI